ncbi:MAG: sulfotransferase family 2 domain-containing protein [Acetobacteraceae bacterium]|nr:sulfotransferase family 2 domain-containing protein [Acetobacteraceae bacterium]
MPTPMNPAAERFFDHFLLVHTHVEKTAGTTLVGHLTRLFGAEHVLDLRSAEVPRPADLEPQQRRAVWLLTGHFHRGAHEGQFDRRPIRLALVRQPLDRAISYYKFVHGAPTHPAHERFGHLPFPEAIRKMLELDAGPIRNEQSRMLTGMNDPKWPDVVYAVEQQYAAVCTQSSVVRLAALFNECFGVDLPCQYLNRGRPGTPHLDEETQRLIEETNALDIRLFQYVERHETRLLNGLGCLLRATLPVKRTAKAAATAAMAAATRVFPSTTEQSAI